MLRRRESFNFRRREGRSCRGRGGTRSAGARPEPPRAGTPRRSRRDRAGLDELRGDLPELLAIAALEDVARADALPRRTARGGARSSSRPSENRLSTGPKRSTWRGHVDGDVADPPDGPEHAEVRREGRLADRVEHEVDVANTSSSAPSCSRRRDRRRAHFTNSAFLALHVVATSAPRCLASWMAKVPTPPEPAWMSTFCPASRLRDVDERLPRGEPDERDRRGLLVARGSPASSRAALVAHERYSAIGADAIFVEAAIDRVADLELGDARADRFDDARRVEAQNPGQFVANEVPLPAAPELPVDGVHRRGDDADEDVARPRRRLVDLVDREHLRPAVGVDPRRLHLAAIMSQRALARRLLRRLRRARPAPPSARASSRRRRRRGAPSRGPCSSA